VRWAEDSRGLPSRIAQTLDRLGYPPHPYRSGSRAEVERREDRALLLRVAVAGACAGNSMLFALALYAGAFSDMDPALLGYFRIWSVLVSLPAVLWSAQVFYRGAWAALRTRSPHMDLPLSLGIVLAAVSGTLNVARGHGDIYFDSLTMLIFVLLSARYLQGAQQRQAEQRAGSAQALTPHTARRVAQDGSVQIVPAESVPQGAQIEVLAGEVIPVDGRVLSGESSVDRGWLTGESQPEAVLPGSSVLAGTTNLAARLVVTSAPIAPCLVSSAAAPSADRADEPIRAPNVSPGNFIPINCAAVPEALFESELFGHEKGSFTGATERMRGKIEPAHAAAPTQSSRAPCATRWSGTCSSPTSRSVRP
jgi:Cu2+-exporting ATPase